MKKITLGFELSVDEGTGQLQAAYLRVRTGGVAETKEIAPGQAYADYDEDGQLLGVEFLAPCGVAVVDQITVDQPDNVRRFLRSAPPREFVTA